MQVAGVGCARPYQGIVVVTSPCELLEVLAGSWCMFDVQLDYDIAYGGLQLDLWCAAEGHSNHKLLSHFALTSFTAQRCASRDGRLCKRYSSRRTR